MKEAGTEHWDSPNVGGNNGSGFTALAAGSRIPNSYPSDYFYLEGLRELLDSLHRQV